MQRLTPCKIADNQEGGKKKETVKHQNKSFNHHDNILPNISMLYAFHLGGPHVLDILQLVLPAHDTFPLLIRWYRVDPFIFPSLDPLNCVTDLPTCYLISLAHRALSRDKGGFINQLHATSLSSSVLLCTMGTESTPLIVSASKNLLIVETHCVFEGGRSMKLVSRGIELVLWSLYGLRMRPSFVYGSLFEV